MVIFDRLLPRAPQPKITDVYGPDGKLLLHLNSHEQGYVTTDSSNPRADTFLVKDNPDKARTSIFLQGRGRQTPWWATARRSWRSRDGLEVVYSSPRHGLNQPSRKPDEE